jgi:hypothetical protein
MEAAESPRKLPDLTQPVSTESLADRGLQAEAHGLEVGVEKLTDWYERTRNPIVVSDEVQIDVDGWFQKVGD